MRKKFDLEEIFYRGIVWVFLILAMGLMMTIKGLELVLEGLEVAIGRRKK